MTRSHVAFGPSYILIALVRGPSQTHVLAGKVARTCGEGRYLLPDFASNACPLCLKRLPSLPQTLSSAPANVCLRFWLFLPRDDERYGLPLAPWISSLIRLFVWGGGRMSVTYRSQGECRPVTCILCGEQNLHKWQSSRNFVPYYIYKKKYIWIHSNSFAV